MGKVSFSEKVESVKSLEHYKYFSYRKRNLIDKKLGNFIIQKKGKKPHSIVYIYLKLVKNVCT